MGLLFHGRGRKLSGGSHDGDSSGGDSAAAAESVGFVSANSSLTVAIEPGSERITDLLNRNALAEFLEDLLLVFPPARPTDPGRRLHRVRQPIEVRVGPFEVTGTMHVPPGTDAAGFLARANPRFVPITHATIRRRGATPPEWNADVVLLNASAMLHLTPVG